MRYIADNYALYSFSGNKLNSMVGIVEVNSWQKRLDIKHEWYEYNESHKPKLLFSVIRPMREIRVLMFS